MNLEGKTLEELIALRISIADEINVAGKAKKTDIVNAKMAEWRIVNKKILELE